MLSVFEEASSGHSGGWYVRFACAEIASLIAGAAEAWLHLRSEREVPVASAVPDELTEAQRQIDLSIAGMVHAIANHQFEKARVHSEREREARETLRRLREKCRIDR
jgi:hypothetical protein